MAVLSWQGFEDLTSDLQRAGTAKHKFIGSGVEVDVVPFRDLETPDRRIDWGDGTLMNAVGLSEAFTQSERVRSPGGTEVHAPTVAASLYSS